MGKGPQPGRGGGYSHTLPINYGYVPPNGVVILKLLNGVPISEAFSRTGVNI